MPADSPTEPSAPVQQDQQPEKGTPWLAIVIASSMILAGGGAAAWYFVLRKRK